MRTLWFPKAVVKYVNMLLLLLLLFVESGLGRDPINIYWNSTNPIFSSSNPTLIDVNKNTGPWEYDQINIICPSGPRTTEKHVIYSVNKGKQNQNFSLKKSKNCLNFVLNSLQPEMEFNEFKRRFKFKPRFKFAWFHLKLYQMFQDLSRR